VLQKADGVIATVGLEAENPNEPAPPSATTSPGAAAPVPENSSASAQSIPPPER